VVFHRNLNGMDARAESLERKFDRGYGIFRRAEFLKTAALTEPSEETWLPSGEAALSPLELMLPRDGRKVMLERFRETAVQNLSQALMISTYCSLDDGSNSLELREVWRTPDAGEVAGEAGEQSEPHGVDNAAERKEEAFDDWCKELVEDREGRLVLLKEAGLATRSRINPLENVNAATGVR
jgi:hypothetical protein